VEKKLSPDRSTDMHTETHTSLALLLLSGQVYSGSHEDQMEEEKVKSVQKCLRIIILVTKSCMPIGTLIMTT